MLTASVWGFAPAGDMGQIMACVPMPRGFWQSSTLAFPPLLVGNLCTVPGE